MKTLKLIVCLAFASNIALSQAILIVDHNFNAPTGANIYATLQEAVDAAATGDIIQVQPSPTAYGNVSIDKQVTLMGIGFNLTKEVPLISTLGTITLTNTIDNGDDASGTIITGLNFTWLYLGVLTGPAYTLSDVTVHNNTVDYIYNISTYSDIDNLKVYSNRVDQWLDITKTIINSIIYKNVFRGDLTFDSSSPCDVIITNNIIYGDIDVLAAASNVTILNNDFVGVSPTTKAFDYLLDIVVSNNIFYGRTPARNANGSASSFFDRNIFTNNMSYVTGNDALPPAGTSNTGSGNSPGVNPDLTAVPVLSTWSAASDFTLAGGSPAIDAGSDGTDIGITGGLYPWTDPNLILQTTAAPTIEILDTSTVINPGDDLPVRVKAKSN